MKLVIDCNVFVSAALGSKACQQVIEKAVLHCDIFLYENERPTSNVQRPTSNNDVASLPKILK